MIITDTLISWLLILTFFIIGYSIFVYGKLLDLECQILRLRRQILEDSLNK